MISFTVAQSYADMSKVKTNCYPSTSTVRAGGKRNLEEEAVNEEPMEGQGQSEEMNGEENGAVSMETEDSKSKSQKTSKKGE